MKNFRKILALVLAVVMTVSTYTVAFAAEEKTSGEVLKTLGLIVGNATGDLMEDSTITRAEVAQIIVKVMGWELEPASAYKFADSTWAKAQAATLVKKAITSGIGNNKFGGAVTMDALQVYAWAYAALTGDTASAWANPSLLSVVLPADQVAAIIASKGITAKRKDIFAGMVTILTTVGVDGKTQLDKLVAAGKVTEAQVVAAGLKTVVTENVITSVELLNYKEAKVTFSVEASDSKDAYKFGGKVVTNVTRSADKKEAIVVMADKLEQQKNVTFNYESGAYKFEKKDFSIIDATMPAVVDVKTSNKGEITITFTEAMEVAPSVKVDGGYVYASVDAVKADFRTFTVKVPSISEGAHKIEISDAKDFAGFKMVPKTYESFEYVKVTAPVTVSVKEANSKQIVLELSAATVKTTVDKANFTYILNKEVTAATVSTDGKTITLSLVNYPAPAGNWTLTVKKANEMFEDSWGNKASADAITLAFTVAIDEIAPTVTVKTVKQADGEIVLEFNEAVTTAATVQANYEILGADGKKIDTAFNGTVGTISENNKEVTLKINKKAFKTENVTLVVLKDKIADLAGNKIAADVKLTFATKYMDDLTATAKVVADAGKTNKIYVTYKNNMLATTLDAAKWAITYLNVDGDRKTVAIDTIKFDETAEIVIITLKEKVAIVGLVITTSALEDVDGNKILGSVLSYTFPTPTAISTTTTMTATAADVNVVEVVIEGKVVDGIKSDAFKLATTTKTVVSAVQNVAFKDGKTTIKVVLLDAYKLNAAGILVASPTTTSAKINISVEGLVLNSGVTLVNTSVEVQDKIAPTVGDVLTKSATNDIITFKLSEEVTATSLFVTELVVKYDGTVLVAGVDFEASILTDVLTVDLSKYEAKADKDVVVGKDVVVSLAKASNYAKDTTGNTNALAAFEKTVTLN